MMMININKEEKKIELIYVEGNKIVEQTFDSRSIDRWIDRFR